MSQLTAVNIAGTEVPVFSVGDSDDRVSEVFRVGTAQGVGFVPLTDVSEAQFNHLQVGTGDSQLAIHNEPTIGIQFGEPELVDDFEDGNKQPSSPKWGEWKTRFNTSRELGGADFSNTSNVPQGNRALLLESEGTGFAEADTTRNSLIELKKLEMQIYVDPGILGDKQDAISMMLIDDTRRAGLAGVEFSGNGNVGVFFDPPHTGVSTSQGLYNIEVVATDKEVSRWDILVNGTKVGNRRAAPIDYIQLQADGENNGGNWRGVFDNIRVWGEEV